MKLTIFTRIVVGYLAIFIPMAAVSVYVFSQLKLFRSVTDDISQVDNRMRDAVQKITDFVLAQTRYEQKYIITKDKEFRQQFMLVDEDVKIRMDEAMSIAKDERKKEMLIRISKGYAYYSAIFAEEADFVEKDIPYIQAPYKEKKEQAVDGILSELQNVELYIEQDTYEKIKHLRASAAEASQIAIVMAALCVLWGIMTSILITRSITIPLFFMRKKTKQIAGGDFDCSLDLNSPPEIGELAKDFNLMCSRLKTIDKMKTDFFSLMAHELRTPLASIQEGTHLLLNHRGEDFKEKQSVILRIIAEESNRLTDLVNALLDLSKMEAGMIALNLKKSDIGYLINRAVFGLGPLAMMKNISIKVEMAQDLPYVAMDAERILQALRNLIGNAVKFTPEGGRITISAHSLKEGVQVSIADTGPGVAKEDINTIFDKFRQGTMTNYSKIKGTGLGLAIVKHIINAHGGKIWVESEPRRGSTFIFLLPA